MSNFVLSRGFHADGPHQEERVVRRGELDMRLVFNRPHRHIRFVDHWVGNYDLKRDLLDEIARREGLRKVYTLVEKSDSNNWRAVGFSREGVYPGFFRTADAHVMSRRYDESSEPLPSTGPLKPTPAERETYPEPRLRKPDGLTVEPVADAESRTELLRKMNGALRALPFGRITGPDVVLHARARKREGWICAEIDDSFGHATIGFAPPPEGDPDLNFSAYVANDLVAGLVDKDVGNVFGLCPADDTWSYRLFVSLGFRVTGRLAGHLKSNGHVANALLLHRRLGANGGETTRPPQGR